MRTVHQHEAKAQLLVAISRAAGNPWTAAHAAGVLPDQAEPHAAIEAATNEKVRCAVCAGRNGGFGGRAELAGREVRMASSKWFS